jgi:CubicO group peptidase (beta-lactamase class C family)
MMKNMIGVIVLILGASFVSAATPATKPATTPAGRDISAELQPIVQKYKLPGMAALAIEGNQVTLQGAAGVRWRGGGGPITINDQFHMGSDSKAMTATLCAMLVEEGKLSWDTTLADVFPKEAPKMNEGFRKCTLRNLLTNRGGCPEDISSLPIWATLYRMNGNPVPARHALLVAITSQPPVAPPGTKFVYSNVNFALAGHMAEEVMHKPWEQLMTERLFKPLGMKSAGFGPPKGAQPRGHNAAGKAMDPNSPQSDNPSGIAPANAVHCSLPDWAKFVAFHLTRGASNPGLLKPETFDVLHKPEGEGADAYAMGWIVAKRGWAKGAALTHMGSNTMWMCTVWIAPKANIAVMVATNEANANSPKACDEAVGELLQAQLKE